MYSAYTEVLKILVTNSNTIWAKAFWSNNRKLLKYAKIDTFSNWLFYDTDAMLYAPANAN